MFTQLPRRVLLGNSSLRWSCSQIGLFLPVTVVAQTTSRQDHEHQRQHPKAKQKAVAHGPRGGKRAYGCAERVDGGMHQYGHKHATFGVVENPRDDDGKEVTATRRRGPSWNPKLGQVPKCPQQPQDDGPYQRTIKRLQAGQREAAPAYFLLK